MFKTSPGPCPVCGAAHTSCTAGPGPIAVVQLPARDEVARVPLVAELVQATLPAGETTTGTYRRKKGPTP